MRGLVDKHGREDVDALCAFLDDHLTIQIERTNQFFKSAEKSTLFVGNEEQNTKPTRFIVFVTVVP